MADQEQREERKAQQEAQRDERKAEKEQANPARERREEARRRAEEQAADPSTPSDDTVRITEDAEDLHERAMTLAKAQLGEDAPERELNKRVEDILLNYGAHVPEMSDEQLQAQRDANRQIDSEGRPEDADDRSAADSVGNAEGGVLTQAKAEAARDRAVGRPATNVEQ